MSSVFVGTTTSESDRVQMRGLEGPAGFSVEFEGARRFVSRPDYQPLLLIMLQQVAA